MPILKLLGKSAFLGPILRRVLMSWRKVRRGNPVEREMGGRSVLLNYANGIQLGAIDAFPDREPEFSARLLASLDAMVERPCLLDIGANIGLYVVASAIRTTCSVVHAFEPDHLNFGVLKQNVDSNCLNDSVTLWNIALGREAGRLFTDSANSGSGSFAPARENGDIEIEVRCVDDMWKAGQIGRPTHLLIDVEGAEGDVLDGAQNMLSALKPKIFVEIHHNKLTDFGTNILDFHAKMLKLGYALEWLRTPSKGPGQHSQFHAIYSSLDDYATNGGIEERL